MVYNASMKPIEIFLNNQERFRSYDLCSQYMCLKPINEYSKEKSILVIGGGTGVYQFPRHIKSAITNIDLKIHKELMTEDYKINNHQGDFIKTRFRPDTFDEIWALFSLPLYSATVDAARMFFHKSVYYLKPGGTLRIAPATPAYLFEDTERPTLRRGSSIRKIYHAIYSCMDDFVNIGGESKILWSHLYSDNQNISSDDIIAEVRKLPSFSWTNFDKYKNISHQLQRPTIHNCAIITKPHKFTDGINKLLLGRIRKLNKTMTYPKILVRQ